MTAKELSRVHELNREIRMWQRELDQLRYSSVIKAQELTGMPGAHMPSDNVAKYVTDIVEIETVIKGKLVELMAEKRKLVKFIAGVEDGYIRQIIYHRAVQDKKWEEIADIMGGSAGALKKTYSRFLRGTQKLTT